MGDYQITEIGRIPIEWNVRKIGQFSDVTKLAGFEYTKYVNYVDDGEIIALRALNLRNGLLDLKDIQRIPKETSDSLERSKLYKNDILLSYTGTIGQFALVDANDKYHLAPNICRIRVSSKCIPYYLYCFMRSRLFQATLINYSVGSTQPTIPMGNIRQIPIALPPLPEQKAIAGVLSSLDDKIDLLHRQNKTLEAMAETLFRQWFIEEAQDDWETVDLSEYIDISSGKGLKRDQYIEDGTFPVLGANGEIGRTNKYLYNDRLLFTGRVGTLGNVFRVENAKVWLSDNTLVIKPKDYFNFIYFVLKKARLERYNVGSTQPLIRQSDIKEISISLPSAVRLSHFEQVSDLYFLKIGKNESQIRLLEKLRNTLVPKLISGEVRVAY